MLAVPDSYIWPALERHPDKCGSAMCIKGTRIAAWMLWHSKQSGSTDKSLCEAYQIAPETLLVVWDYCEKNRIEIEHLIKENASV